MSERVIERPVDELIDEIDQKLDHFKVSYRGLTLRSKVLLLVELGYDTRCLSVNVVREHGYSITAAKDRLRTYLTEHVQIVVEGAELDVVSGISDYPRRVRELRVEEGYRILTGSSPDPSFSELDLRPDQYLLASTEPDVSAARRWHVANRIKKSSKSVRDKILDFLLETVGQVVTTEELAYVSNEKREFAKRVRELRTEDGFAIATKATGRPDLGIGEYILLSANRMTEEHDRHIPIDLQRSVYQRDNNTCRTCGWTVGRYTLQDPRILELHNLQPNASQMTAQNLIVLCSLCHDEVHASTLDISHINNG